MYKQYVVFYLSADGRFYDHVIVKDKSFAGAYKSAKLFCKKSGLSLMGIIEECTLEQNCQILNS